MSGTTTGDPAFEQAPTGRPTERLDVVDAGPPAPLKDTLERLADLPGDVLLVQYNDRAPQYLYPKLEDRGYSFETVDAGETVVTAIWR